MTGDLRDDQPDVWEDRHLDHIHPDLTMRTDYQLVVWKDRCVTVLRVDTLQDAERALAFAGRVRPGVDHAMIWRRTMLSPKGVPMLDRRVRHHEVKPEWVERYHAALRMLRKEETETTGETDETCPTCGKPRDQ